MSSPYSKDAESTIKKITESLTSTADVPVDIQTTSSGTESQTSQPFSKFMAGFTVSEKTSRYLVIGYFTASVVGSILWTRHRTEEDENKKKKINIGKVIMWLIVFNIPLFAVLYLKPSARPI